MAKKNNIIELKKKIKCDECEIELAQDEISSYISKMEKKIHNKQNMFIGALTVLIDACYFHAPSSESATHLILTAHQRVLECRKEEEDDTI